LPRATFTGFTIVELMVVIAIIVLAAGLMTPTITDFFRNRRLEGVRGQFGSAFNSARLTAVNERVRVSLVFFREGVRVFNERDGRFTDEFFSPESSLLSGDEMWYVLGFLDSKPSTAVMPYQEWEKRVKVEAQLKPGGQASGAQSPGVQPGRREPRISVRDLPRITFERDGTLTFTSGADVSTTSFQQEVPELADMVIYQAGNSTACFIDFRPTGQMRSKTVPLENQPPRPLPAGVPPEASPGEGGAEAPREGQVEEGVQAGGGERAGSTEAEK
jgi:hypothetical protein